MCSLIKMVKEKTRYGLSKCKVGNNYIACVGSILLVCLFGFFFLGGGGGKTDNQSRVRFYLAARCLSKPPKDGMFKTS